MAEDKTATTPAEAEPLKPKQPRRREEKIQEEEVSQERSAPPVTGAGKTVAFSKHSIVKALRHPTGCLENHAGRDCTDREAAKFA